jgi:arylsulfatase A-like enzyme
VALAVALAVAAVALAVALAVAPRPPLVRPGGMLLRGRRRTLVLAVFIGSARQCASAAASSGPVCVDRAASCPHLVTLLADDLGWFDTSIHNPAAPTPRMTELLSEGYRLDRHYVYRYCSPTRRSMLSGRWPVHITGQQAKTCSNLLPLSCTLLSEKLKLANYSSHFVGKGHLGWLTEDHLMINRGFDSHLGYLAGAESYAYGVSGEQPDLQQHAHHKHDMWQDHAPAWDTAAEIDYSPTFYSAWAARKLRQHAATRPTQPLCLHFPVQNVSEN